MPILTREYHSQQIQTMKELARHNKWWTAPLNLGGVPGSGGGQGIPPGGIFGMLIQTKVTYDTSELVYSGIQTNVPSGTLVDNLAHIRFSISGLDDRVLVLEETSHTLVVQEEGVTVVSGVTLINFEGQGVTASQISETGVTVAFSGFAATSISGVSLRQYNETPSGVPAPSGTLYYTNYKFLADTLRVFQNGLRQSPNYFNEHSSRTAFDTTFATVADDELLIDYNWIVVEQIFWGFSWGEYWS